MFLKVKGVLMKKQEKLNDELSLVGSIFILLILISSYLISNYKKETRISKLEQEVLSTKQLAILIQSDLDKTENQLSKVILEQEELVNDLKDVQVLIKIKEQLRGYTYEEKAIGLAMAWTESSWRFILNHGSNAEGICGVEPNYWREFLNDKDIELNSIAACIEIYKYYKDKNGTRYEAIKQYKGIINNTHIIEHTIIIRNTILNILEEEYK